MKHHQDCGKKPSCLVQTVIFIEKVEMIPSSCFWSSKQVKMYYLGTFQNKLYIVLCRQDSQSHNNSTIMKCVKKKTFYGWWETSGPLWTRKCDIELRASVELKTYLPTCRNLTATFTMLKWGHFSDNIILWSDIDVIGSYKPHWHWNTGRWIMFETRMLLSREHTSAHLPPLIQSSLYL